MAGDLPEVDVVLVSWERGDTILESLESVARQEGVRSKVFVADQGSAPATLDALRRLDRSGALTLKELGRNLGVASGRNAGLAMGGADYVACLDDDARFSQPDALARALRDFRDDPMLGAVGFRIKDDRTLEDDRASWAFPRPLRERAGERFLATRFPGAGHAFSRRALERTQGYDPRITFYWEELDLSYQLLAAGFKILYEPSIVVLHKRSPLSRLHWREGRYYYYVRHGIYVTYKYFRSPGLVSALAAGYLVKGVYNGVFVQALRGASDGLRMIREVPVAAWPVLDRATLDYIYRNDVTHRGSLWRRLKDEVFERLV
ncbi:MAG: glycosyltransferase family 2 protein [Anaerolineales bacterium]